LRHFVLVAYLLLASTPSFAGTEASAIGMFSKAALDQCLVDRSNRLKRTEAEDPQALPILSSIYSTQYCTCVADEIGQHVPPELIHSSRQSELTAAVIPLASKCALQSFRTALPSTCIGWYQSLFRATDWLSDEKQTKVCSCLQESTASIKPTELIEVTRDTLSDYRDWQSRPELSFKSPRPKSILGSVGECARRQGVLQ
jgi:hypothetical protein